MCAPLLGLVVLLDTILGIGRRIAEIFLAEVGVDPRRFPTAAHLLAWAGFTPGSNASARKQQPATTCKGSPWLRVALVELA